MNSRLFFLLIGSVAAWIIAFNTGRELAFSIAYLLSGVIVLSYVWAWNSVRGVTARRRTRSRRSQVGQYVEEQFEVTNQSFWPKLWVELRDESTMPWHRASRVVSAQP